MRLLCAGALCVLILTRLVSGQVQDEAASGAAGWPHLRGPHYTGISDERHLADTWPTDGPPVLWARELGQGYSSFVASGDKLFTQMQSLYGQYVVCLNAHTGATVWEHRYGWPYEGAGLYPGPRATPTFHEGKIYFSGTDGTIGCLEADTGKPQWTVNVNQEFKGLGTDFGYSCSPLVEDGKVILPVGGKGASIVALDARNGATLWKSGNEPASYCSALPITLNGRRIVVGLLQNALSLRDFKTGKILWERNISHGYDEHAACPLYDEPFLLVAIPFRGGATLYRFEDRLAAADAEDADQSELAATSVWQNTKFSNDVASSVLVDGKVYGFDLRDPQSKLHRPSRGTFRCLDLKTGKEQWATDTVGQAGIIVADGKLVLFNDSGELILARATDRRYEELARTQVFRNEICWTAPALHQGSVYLRTQSRAACLYLGEPKALSTRQVSTAKKTAEIAGSQTMDLTQLVGGEREHPLVRPDVPELQLWYAFSLIGVLGVAAVLAAAVLAVGKLVRKPVGVRTVQVIFACSAFLASVAGTPLYNRFWHSFVFTWPAGLFLSFQAAIVAIVWAEAQSNRKPARWLSRAAVFALLGVCFTYFHLCRKLSMGHESVFLIGFVPAWPIAILTARRLVTPAGLAMQLAWVCGAFTAYFWSCGVYCLLQSATGF